MAQPYKGTVCAIHINWVNQFYEYAKIISDLQQNAGELIRTLGQQLEARLEGRDGQGMSVREMQQQADGFMDDFSYASSQRPGRVENFDLVMMGPIYTKKRH